MSGTALDSFSPATRSWFSGAFSAPTAAQEGAWRAIAEGSDVLVVAPTGSGKTLAAFLAALDRLASVPPPAEARKRCRVLYVSPLKALAVDVERNLRSPLTGIRQESVRLGQPEPEIRVGIRSGDTPAAERRSMATKPPDILITTPESLFLMLTSSARDALAGVETVILDEVHAVAGTKRGAHLAVSLERLDELLPRPARRIGLSATVRPVDEVARYLSPSAGWRSCSLLPGRSSTCRWSSPSRTWASWAAPRRPTAGAAAPGATATSRRSGRTSRSASPISSRRTVRRSSSPTPGASPSASATGSTRSRTSGPRARPCPKPTPPPRSWPSRAPPRAPRPSWPAPTTVRSPRSSGPGWRRT